MQTQMLVQTERVCVSKVLSSVPPDQIQRCQPRSASKLNTRATMLQLAEEPVNQNTNTPSVAKYINITAETACFYQLISLICKMAHL